MKKISNDIVLRPRFQLDLVSNKEHLLAAFEKTKKEPFHIKRLDDHLFIKFTKENSHFWSPQLHLEITEIDKKNSRLFGLFGPNPTLWTFFMFLHFGVATLFIILGIWAYVSATLNKPYGLQVGFMVLLVILWFTLYFFGRLGKKKGQPQMQEMYTFMMDLILKV
ncbi:GTP-binding protein [Maribacter sp. CXY002]|uniref:GTP-binding protein n=1 Tax=Maribacter luteocoastalis TaxID=3407671 RepID=UPI003B66C5DA